MRADRIFIIAPDIDDSLKRFCPSYDIEIFPDFPTFEKYVDTTPDIVHSVIVTDTILPFTGANMQRLIDTVRSPFLTVEQRTIYLYSKSISKEAIKKWTDTLDGFPISAYQGDIDDQFIIGIVNGKLRDADEEKVEEVTYRYRASEYAQDQKIKRYESSNDGDYVTDEDEMAGIPDVEQPEEYVSINETPMIEFPIVGAPSQARTLVAFIEAQYLALSSKTLIVEYDFEYHRLTDIALKSGVEFEYFDVADIVNDISETINKIKMSKKNLIVIGCTSKLNFSYTFLKQILSDTLKDYVQNFVIECDFKDTPFSANYAVVFDDTMPELLRTVNSLIYPIDINKNVLVGVRFNNWQPYNLTTQELSDVACDLLGLPEVVAQTITITGSTIKKENAVYDLFSIIGRGNRR